MARDAVGAEQEDSAVFDLSSLHVHFNRRFRAERAADHVATRMIGGLLGRHPPGTYLFFDDRMIFGLAVQRAVGREAIETRVADVAEGRAPAVQMERNDGRGHHRKVALLVCELIDRGIGALDGQLHQVLYVVAGLVMAKRFVQHVHGRLRCNLAGLRAAHAIGDGEDAPRRVEQIRIFVERSFLA